MLRSFRRAFAFVAFAFMSLVDRAAHADFGEPSFGPGTEGIDGTPRFQMLQDVAYTNALMFGAVGMFDRHIQPSLLKARELDHDGLVITLGLEETMGVDVAKVFGRCAGDAHPDYDCAEAGENRLFGVNTFNTGGALYVGTRNVGGFFSWSYSITYVGDSPDYGFAPTGMGVVALFPALGGRDVFASVFPGAVDMVGGGHIELGPIQAQGGYIFSKGLFGNVVVPEIYAFSTLALTDSFSALGLLRAGLRQVQWSAEEEVRKISGQSSLFVQRLLLGAVSEAAPELAGVVRDARRELGVGMLSVHALQEHIANHIDVGAALGHFNTPFLHQAQLSAHTDEAEYFQAGVLAGVIQLPAMWHLGYDGKPRLRVEGEIGFNARASKTDEPNTFRVFFRMNNPEVLMAFPYSEGYFFGFEAVYR